MNEDYDGGISTLVAVGCTLIIGMILGTCIGISGGEDAMKNRAIQAGVAHYNATNAIFEFNTNLNFERK